MVTEYQFEPALNTAIPRSAAPNLAASCWRMFFWLLFAAIVTLQPYFAIQNINNLTALQQSGRNVVGTVTSTSEYYSHGRSHYTLFYTYHIGDSMYSDHKPVSYENFWNKHIGSGVNITYLPTNPSVNFVGPVTAAVIAARTNAGITSCLIFSFLTFGLALFVELNLQFQLKLLRIGIPVEGMVTDTRVIQGKSTSYRLICTYKVGVETVVKNYTVTRPIYDVCSVGMPITIIVDPVKPRSSMPYRSITSAVIKPSSAFAR